jgi:hypothetical protein
MGRPLVRMGHDARRVSPRMARYGLRAVTALIGLLLLALPSSISSAPARPLTYDRPITEVDVAGRSLRELAILRNTIFARHGQPFRKVWLHEYFSKQSWYKPTGVVDPRTLSPVEQQNADFLSRYEIALPRAELERRLQPILAKHRNQFGMPQPPHAVSWAKGGSTVLFATWGSVYAFDVASGRPVGNVSTVNDVGALSLVSGQLRAVAFDQTGTVLSIDLSAPAGKNVTSTRSLAGKWFRYGVISPDGRRLLLGPAYDREDENEPAVVEAHVVAVDVASEKVLVSREVTEDERPCLAITSSGDRALIGSCNRLTLWDLASGKPLWKYPRRKDDSCALSPDGRRVLADNVLLDGRSGAVEHKLELGPFDQRSDIVAFSPSGDRVLVGGNGHNGRPFLVLLGTADGRRIRPLDAASTVSAIAWSPDGKRALTFGTEGLAIWDIETGHRTSALPGHLPWTDHDEEIEALLLSRALGRDLPGVSGIDSERTPLDAPALLDELMPVATLERMSRRDLRLLRNMVYARRGRPFRSEILRDYFERLDWYKADPAYTDARLTAVDHRNIKIIQSAEIKAGGPMSDREHAEADLPEA